ATLRHCRLASARRCNFEGAKLQDCDLGTLDLRGCRFRKARLKTSALSGADLRGCDFRGALLENVTFQDVRLDKTTDLRGAKLLNILDRDFYDQQRGSVLQGTDWRQANYDETTQYGEDPAFLPLLGLKAALAALRDHQDPLARKLERILEE